jgi:hypothetical protein
MMIDGNISLQSVGNDYPPTMRQLFTVTPLQLNCSMSYARYAVAPPSIAGRATHMP